MRKWRNALLAAVILLTVLLCACSLLPQLIPSISNSPLPAPAAPTPSAAQIEWDGQIQNGIPSMEDTYFIWNMPEEERELCIGIYQGIMAFDEEIKFPAPVDENTLSDAMWLLSYDCPELFQISGDYSYYVREDMPEKVLSVKPTYILSETEYAQASANIKDKLTNWLEAAKGLDEFEKERLIYDSIIQCCDYREDGVHAGTAYGALVLGQARCEGYSKALCMALRAADIPCLILTGEAWSLEEENAQPEKHAWNVARIGRNYYEMDITWDDSDGQLPQGTCYAYFNLTDKEMYLSRRLDDIYEGWGLPVCDDTVQNYYVRNGAFFKDGVDLKAAFSDALNAAYENGETMVMARVETDEQMEEIQDHLKAWMENWMNRRRLSSVSYNWMTYKGSRVFCILGLTYEK